MHHASIAERSTLLHHCYRTLLWHPLRRQLPSLVVPVDISSRFNETRLVGHVLRYRDQDHDGLPESMTYRYETRFLRLHSHDQEFLSVEKSTELRTVGTCPVAAKAQDNIVYKKLSYRRGTARCVVSVEILPIAMQQCRNYLYDKSWTNRSYEVGVLRWADV